TGWPLQALIFTTMFIGSTPGKAQCRDPDFIHYLKHVFQVA
ncbi:hypothetical protein, partial [Pseudomonas aeruginosa]